MDTTKNKYYKPTSAEINEIINSTVPENTQKATAKWVKILGNWRHDVGYNYGIETIIDKDQLENEMTEFILANKEYAPSSLITIGGQQNIRKASREDEEDNFSEDTAGVSIVKNYYITATHVNIN